MNGARMAGLEREVKERRRANEWMGGRTATAPPAMGWCGGSSRPTADS